MPNRNGNPKLIQEMCYLCMKTEKDTMKFGEFMIQDSIGVHYYCLLLSSGLEQNGKDDQEFLGFLRVDILREAKRVRLMKCYYCKKYSANIGCCEARCRKNFHLICGIKYGAQNQFINTYRSFCNLHIKKYLQKLLPNNIDCIICLEKLGYVRKYTQQIRLPCCKGGWFHKWCMQEYADNAGYFLKCPLCNNTDKFVTALKFCGIYISLSDAKWELEPNAYEELQDRPNICTAGRCFCPDGREINDCESDDFELIYCSTCGSVAQHIKCSGNNNSFTCAECTGILSKYQNKTNNSQCIIPKSEMDIDHNEEEEEEKVESKIKTSPLFEIVDNVHKLEHIFEEPVIDVEEYDSVATKLKVIFRSL